jgi:hypothetical protein
MVGKRGKLFEFGKDLEWSGKKLIYRSIAGFESLSQQPIPVG